ncbi:MAG: ribonuclease HII [Patescibacteria group bacterium]|jgi:ribonuclease HII
MLEINKENSLFMQGFKLVAGLDEAGRGPLAGPVVAAVAVLNPEILLDSVKLEKLKGINDSKKISAKKREELFDIIKENFFEIGVGVVNHQTIDRINILQATFLAMKMALGNLKSKPDILLVDGKFPIPNLSLRQEAIINGDALIFSIAAASIVAKVTRDRLMDEYDKKYPQYGFAKHAGYGTKFHMEALKQFGPCEIHRKTFKPVTILLKYF